MKTRVLTSTFLVITLVPLFLIGGLVLQIGLLLLSLGATYELSRMYKGDAFKINEILVLQLIFNGTLFWSIVYYLRGTLDLEYLFVLLLLILIITGLTLVFKKEFKADDLGRTLFIVLYPSIGFAGLAWLRYLGLYDIGFLFMVTIFTDIFAYVVGVNFGKHRLAPTISPKKSIEGTVGGTLVALIITMLFIYLLKMESIAQIDINIGTGILLVVFMSLIGQIGDLIASKLKRGFGLKDFSNLFPGHGGIMDRFDSAVFAAIVLLFISKVVGLL